MRYVITILLITGLISCKPQEKKSPQTDAGQPSYSGNCGYVTVAELEEALGTRLAEPVQEITDDYLGGFGCSFAGENTNGAANFGYIIFPSQEAFENLHDYEPYPGLGDEAYTINGADALQLWVQEGDNRVMVALGDRPKLEMNVKLARLILERLKTKPLNK